LRKFWTARASGYSTRSKRRSSKNLRSASGCHFDERDARFADLVNDRVMCVEVAVHAKRFLVLADVRFVERQIELLGRSAAARIAPCHAR
jgi:hypothetical protein